MQTWQIDLNGLALTGTGGQDVLGLPMTAFFASRQCPGTAIRAAMDWALQQASAKQVVISGFHSPLEQSVLKVLIAARSPAVVVLARPLQGARLPPEWGEPLTQGHMTVVSATRTTGRLTTDRADQRNLWVAQLATQIVVAHATPGGRLSMFFDQWHAQNKAVTLLT